VAVADPPLVRLPCVPSPALTAVTNYFERRGIWNFVLGFHAARGGMVCLCVRTRRPRGAAALRTSQECEDSALAQSAAREMS